MPDGSKQTTENAFYVVDTSVLYEKLTFKLEAISKHQRKKTIVTKQVLAVIKPNVSESCVYFGSEGICQVGSTSSKEFNPLKIFFEEYLGSSTNTFKINIDASLPDYSGIYEIKDNISDVKNHIASMRYSHTVPDYVPTGGANYYYNVFNGTMVIYQSNGYWHAILNNAQAIHNTNNQIVNVSANLLFKISN
jgi:hypothetical protein